MVGVGSKTLAFYSTHERTSKAVKLSGFSKSLLFVGSKMLKLDIILKNHFLSLQGIFFLISLLMEF